MGREKLASAFEPGPGLVPFFVAGDGGMDATARCLRLADRPGIAAVELGLPFSDPIADGPVIQDAAGRALNSGTPVGAVLDVVRGARSEGVAVPVVLFSYVNPLLAYGFEQFARDAREAGADGVLLVDVPLGESAPFFRTLGERDLATVPLIAPTTPPQRVKELDEACTGFLYLVSRLGTTGARADLPEDVATLIRGVVDSASRPVAVGFGISTPAQVQEIARHAPGVVVGSALVKALAASGTDGVDRLLGELTAPLT